MAIEVSQGSGFRVQGSGFRVQRAWFKGCRLLYESRRCSLAVPQESSGFTIGGLGVQGLWLKGSELRIWGSEFAPELMVHGAQKKTINLFAI